MEQIHIIPINDTQEHSEDIICACKPEIEVCENGNWIVTHNAFDGREWKEMATVSRII